MMKYEWKKIFERKLNLILMIAGYILLGVCLYSFIYSESFYDEKTDSYIKGLEAIHMSQQKNEQMTDVVTEEYVTKMLQDIQAFNIDLESDEGYMKLARHYDSMYYFVAKNYTDMRESHIQVNELNRVDLSNGAQFYEQRMRKIKDFLNMDFSYGNFSQAEKNFWISKAASVKTPFIWGDQTVMSQIMDLVFVGFYLVLVLVACIAPIFAAEKESGASLLLLTTKYGKTRLIFSKMATAFLFCVLYMSIGLLLTITVYGIFLGYPGADLPIQLWNSIIPYNLSAGQTAMLAFVWILMLSLSMTALVAFCSAITGSSMATIVIGFAVMIAPAFFPMSKESGLWNHINYLFPVRVFDFKSVISSYVSYPLGNLVISYVSMVIIVYGAMIVLCLIPMRKAFVKGNVGK